jgi:Undecaprenyl-phosphate glucose phosphotransferase
MEPLNSVKSDTLAIPARFVKEPLWLAICPPSYKMVKDIIRAGDGTLLLAACTLERLPDIQTLITPTADHNHLLANIVGGCVSFAFLSTADGYKIRVLKKYSKQLKRILLSVLAGSGATYLSLLVMHHTQQELITGPARWCTLSILLLASWRGASSILMEKWVRAGKMAKRVAIVGVDHVTQIFINTAKKHRDTCRIVGLYTDEPAPQTQQDDIKIVGPVAQILADSQRERIDSVVISQVSAPNLDKVYHQVLPVIADIQLIGHTFPTNVAKERLTELGGNLVLTVVPKPMSDWQRVIKAAFDRTVAAALIICFSPILLGTALAIKLDSRGDVLFRQPRDGYNNKMFVICKFRSMYAHAADLHSDQQTVKGDKRITRIGKIIRKLSIDELPQLLNVLYGDMSLVGPRPHAPGTKAGGKLFKDVVPNYLQRHKVLPGITGLAQINGYRGDTPTEESIRRRVEYDLQYIQEWSLWLDIKILVLTVFREILSKKAF